VDKNRTVSLCVVVRDDAPFLTRCLESFQDVVHEVCVVFTGEIDGDALALAQAFKAKVLISETAMVHNRCLELATMNWIIMVEADEYLKRDDALALNEALMRYDEDGFLVRILSFSREGTPFYVTRLAPRIFRNNGIFYYEGNFYEQLVSTNPEANFEMIEVGFYQTGLLQRKNDDLTLLKKMIDENGTSMVNLFRLANALSRHPNMRQETLELYELIYKGIDFNADFAPRLVVYRVLALIRAELWDEALCVIEEGLSYFPDFTDLVYQRGVVERKKGLIIRPIRSFEACLEMGKPRSELEFSSASYQYGPMFHLAELMAQEAFFEEAFEYYQECWLLDSNYRLLSRMFDCLVNSGVGQKEIALRMRRFFNLDNDLNRVAYVNLLLEKAFFEEAYNFLMADGTWGAVEKQHQLIEKVLVMMAD